MVKVDAMLIFVADVCAEVLPHNALPRRVEVLIKILLQFFCQHHLLQVLHLAVIIYPHLHEFHCLELHIYASY